ncbi:NAD(P)/FAD-dependent oxidoreductase [Bacillaceae bacterium S4-13-58]
MAEKEIIIIGAGYAGLRAAKNLAKKYKKDPSVSITLIDRHSYHTMMTELHEVAGNRVEPHAVQLDLRRLFNRTKVNLVTDNVTGVDHNSKIVHTEHGSYSYDYLILGMGGEPNDFGTPGVKEHAFTLWSWEDAVEIKEHILKTVLEASKIHDEKKRKAMLTFTVCGSGFTGIEMAGELLEWRDRLARDHKLDPDEITIYVVEAAPTILNMLNRKDAGKAEAYLMKKGVQILKNSPIVEVKAESIVLKSGSELPTHTLIWTAGVQGNRDVKEYGMSEGRGGRIKVNEYMESVDLENVYVVGDLAYFEEEPGTPTPQIVEAAEQTAKTAVRSIISEISGGDKEPFKSNYHGLMVSIGARYGVADVGGMHLSGWFSNLVKHMVNLWYFFGIRSGYYMFHYIIHEFFHTKDKRNIFRDFISRYGNVLWSLPLRIYLGLFWIIEGCIKLWGEDKWSEATSSISSLPKLFTGLGEQSWLVGSTVRMPFDWLQTTTSGASEAAGGTTEWTEPIISHVPGIFAWVMEIFLPTPEMAILVQKIMVFVEIGLGLALLVGLFTWLVGAASAVFIGIFTLSAMLGWEQFWVLPASIALMNGSGRSIGLDYWVVPFLQRFAGNWWYGKEQSIYADQGKAVPSNKKQQKAS